MDNYVYNPLFAIELINNEMHAANKGSVFGGQNFVTGSSL